MHTRLLSVFTAFVFFFFFLSVLLCVSALYLYALIRLFVWFGRLFVWYACLLFLFLHLPLFVRLFSFSLSFFIIFCFVMDVRMITVLCVRVCVCTLLGFLTFASCVVFFCFCFFRYYGPYRMCVCFSFHVACVKPFRVKTATQTQINHQYRYTSIPRWMYACLSVHVLKKDIIRFFHCKPKILLN